MNRARIDQHGRGANQPRRSASAPQIDTHHQPPAPFDRVPQYQGRGEPVCARLAANKRRDATFSGLARRVGSVADRSPSIEEPCCPELQQPLRPENCSGASSSDIDRGGGGFSKGKKTVYLSQLMV